MRLPELRTVRVEDVKPYSGNPRHISQEAVDAVLRSMERYTYVQPILVDDELVVISGHTRLRAVKELGWETVDVLVASNLTPEEARQFRLVDNRTHELSDWAHDKLVAELREWEEALLAAYFGDVDLEIGQAVASVVTEQQVEEGAVRAATVTQAAPDPMTGVRCPDCSHVFHVKTKTLPGVTYEDIEALKLTSG